MSGRVPLQVVPLAEEQIPLASKVMGRAFYDDPLAAYMLPNPEERRKLLPIHFEVLLRYGHLAENVWTTEDIDGLIVCQPPGHLEMDMESMKKSGMADEDMRVGKEAVERFSGVMKHVEPLRFRDAGARHWYVMALCVDSTKQGLGVGSDLLKHLFSLADRDSVPCYLETADADNVRFYNKNGFRLIVEDVEPTSGLRYWTFKREPISRISHNT